MKSIFMIKNEYSARAETTLGIVKKALSGQRFAVTGSYAEHVHNQGYTQLNEDSDLDIAVEEGNVGRTLEALLKMPQLIDSEKVESKNQHMVLGFLTTPIHLIGTLKPNPKHTFLKGIMHIRPEVVYAYKDKPGY